MKERVGESFMKPIDEYINEVYEKYNETESKHQIYKTVKMKPKSSFNPLYGVMLCTLLIIGMGLGIKNYLPQEKEKIQYVEIETKEDGKNVYIDKIKVDVFKPEKQIKKLIKNSTYMAIVSKEFYIATDYEMNNGKFLLKTENQLKIQKVLKGNLEEKQTISCYKYGGELPIEVIEKDETINWKEWEAKYIGRTISESEKKNGIFKQINTRNIDFEEGKQYLIFFDFDEESGKYEISDLVYGIMEYDSITNKVKNIESGEFEEFDWNLIEKEI